MGMGMGRAAIYLRPLRPVPIWAASRPATRPTHGAKANIPLRSEEQVILPFAWEGNEDISVLSAVTHFSEIFSLR